MLLHLLQAVRLHTYSYIHTAAETSNCTADTRIDEAEYASLVARSPMKPTNDPTVQTPLLKHRELMRLRDHVDMQAERSETSHNSQARHQNQLEELVGVLLSESLLIGWC